MATHSNILAWRISWTEEPGGLQSVELQRVGHNWATNTHTHTHTHIHKQLILKSNDLFILEYETSFSVKIYI